MTCRQLIDFLADYLEDELPVDQRRAFDEHLSCCAECREYLRQYRTTVELARRLSDCDDQKPGLPGGLVKAIVSASRRK